MISILWHEISNLWWIMLWKDPCISNYIQVACSSRGFPSWHYCTAYICIFIFWASGWILMNATRAEYMPIVKCKGQRDKCTWGRSNWRGTLKWHLRIEAEQSVCDHALRLNAELLFVACSRESPSFRDRVPFLNNVTFRVWEVDRLCYSLYSFWTLTSKHVPRSLIWVWTALQSQHLTFKAPNGFYSVISPLHMHISRRIWIADGK